MLKQITFQPGNIGINFLGNAITYIDPSSQAKREGVCIGWTIRKINNLIQPNDGAEIIQNLFQASKTKQSITIEFQEPKHTKHKQKDFVRGELLTQKPERSVQDFKNDTDTFHGRKRYIGSDTTDILFQKKKKKSKANSDSKPKESTKRLYLQNVESGISFMGAVSIIHDRCARSELGLTVDLPSSLLGFLPVTEISNEITNRVAIILNSKNAEKVVDVKLLKELFHIGQYVRVIVLSAKRENRKQTIVLSMRPDRFNKGMSFNTLNVDSVVHGSIQSLEDKGYVVNLGMSGYTGFLHLSNIYKQKRMPIIGEALNFVVISKSGRCVQLTFESKRTRNTVLEYDENIHFTSLKPGMLVEASITKVYDDGIEVSFLKKFKGTIDLLHLEYSPEKDWTQYYSELSNRKGSYNARILFVDKRTNHIGLSLRHNLVSLQEYKFKSDLSLGTIIEQATIMYIDPNFGMSLIRNRNPEDEDRVDTIFIHANVNQCHKNKTEMVDLNDSYKVGQSIRCRIISCQHLDGVCSVTMNEELINDALLFVKDLTVGLIISGKVKSIRPSGLLISLSPTITALCPNVHLTDAATEEMFKVAAITKKIHSQFTPGDRLKCRIISIDSSQNRIILTHKSTLVKSNFPILDSFDSVKKGMIIHGIIQRVLESCLIVECYNNMIGHIFKDGLIDDGAMEEDDDLADRFAVGQVITCTILKVNKMLKRLEFQLGGFEEEKKEKEEKEEEEEETDDHALRIGDLVSGSVRAILRDKKKMKIVLHSPWNKIRGFLHSEHMSDHSKNTDQLFETYTHDFYHKSNVNIKEMVLLKRYNNKGKERYVFSMKPSFVSASKKRSESIENKSKIIVPKTKDEIKKGTFAHGYVTKIKSKFIIVTFFGKLKIKIMKRCISQNLVAHPEKHVKLGQSVRTYILGLSGTDFVGSISTLHITPEPISEALLVQSLFTELNRIEKYAVKFNPVKGKPVNPIKYKLGCNINGTVESINKENIVVRLKKNEEDTGQMLGIASKPYHTQENNSQINISIGETVRCRLLDFNKFQGICRISFRRDLIKKPKLRKKKKKKIKIHQHVLVMIQLVLDQYVIVSLPNYNHCIGYSTVSTYNSNINYEVGESYEATILNLPDKKCPRMLLLMGKQL